MSATDGERTEARTPTTVASVEGEGEGENKSEGEGGRGKEAVESMANRMNAADHGAFLARERRRRMSVARVARASA